MKIGKILSDGLFHAAAGHNGNVAAIQAAAKKYLGRDLAVEEAEAKLQAMSPETRAYCEVTGQGPCNIRALMFAFEMKAGLQVVARTSSSDFAMDDDVVRILSNPGQAAQVMARFPLITQDDIDYVAPKLPPQPVTPFDPRISL